jgi:hypothetical protein
MPQKLETVLKKIDDMGNIINRQIIYEYHRYLISRDTSTNYQKDNIKLIHMFAKFLGDSHTFYDIKSSEFILKFLDTKKKKQRR